MVHTVYPAGTRGQENIEQFFFFFFFFLIILAGTDAKAKENKELVQKAGPVKRWCAGGGGN